jgi:hypothetical protein
MPTQILGHFPRPRVVISVRTWGWLASRYRSIHRPTSRKRNGAGAGWARASTWIQASGPRRCGRPPRTSSGRAGRDGSLVTKPAVAGRRVAPQVAVPLDDREQLAGRPAAKRRRRPARTASASTISGVKHQRQPTPPRRARDPQPMTAPDATTARACRSDQRRRGPRARVRTHRSDRYRSDLSRDPPSAAASAHETRRVLLGSCKPVPAGRLPLSRRSRERPSAFSCLFACLAERGKSRSFAGES